MKNYHTLIEELNEGVGEYILKKISKEKYQSDDSDDEMDGTDITNYHIIYNGKVVGELHYETFFGHIEGELHNKDLPELSGYGSNPKVALNKFLKSNTGKKWMNNLQRYSKDKQNYGKSLRAIDKNKNKPMPSWALKGSQR